MANEIDQQRTFEQKLGDRIRDNIGDLMTDDDLKKLIDARMHALFFAKRTVPDGSYNKKEIPSFFDELVADVLKDRVKVAAKEWLNENQEHVDAALLKALGGNMFDLLHNYLKSVTQQSFYEFEQRLRSVGVLR